MRKKKDSTKNKILIIFILFIIIIILAITYFIISVNEKENVDYSYSYNLSNRTIIWEPEVLNKTYNVGDYFWYAKKVNGVIHISKELETAFYLAKVNESDYESCLEMISWCNALKTNCSIERMSRCLVEKDIIEFLEAKKNENHSFCSNCPRFFKVRSEFDNGDVDVEVIENIMKVKMDRDDIRWCYGLIKDSCVDMYCPPLVFMNCLTAEDTEQYYRDHYSNMYSETEVEEKISEIYELYQSFD